MGRKSEYKLDDGQPKKKILSEDVKKKIGRENLSIKEIVAYLNKYTISQRTFNEKTIKNYIGTLCEESNGLIKISDFKKNPKKEKSKYVIKPELHGFLLTLFDSEYFDGRKNERKVATREKMFRSLIKNTELYMSDRDKEIVKANPSYINACLESGLSERLNNELTTLLRDLYNADQMVRFTMMKYVIEELTRLQKWISKEDVKIMSAKLVYGHKLKNGEDKKQQNDLFRTNTLEEYLIKLLAYRIKKSKYTEVNDDEVLSDQSLYLAQKMFALEIKDESDAKNVLDEIDEKIANDTRYKQIDSKAKQILNMNEPYEALIYTTLMNLCRAYYLTPFVSPEDYERTVKFTESAMAEDKWDILNKFVQMGRKSYTEQQIEKIKSIRDVD